jgi:hypothetical protein
MVRPSSTEPGPGLQITPSPASAWKQAYLNLHRETAFDRITHAVRAAEAAIFDRLQELSGSSDHADERAEIRAANEELLSGVNFYGVKLRGVVGQKIARLHPGCVERAFPARRRECRCSEPDASH